MKTLCVFCGSNLGIRPVHRERAHEFGIQLARRGIRLVYGGGQIGLMGVLADAVLSTGGVAIGVIPKFLMIPEIAHSNLTKLEVVKDMHARKQRMFELSHAFAVLPGGLGTLDEAVEMIAWGQLRLHEKPIVMLGNDQFWAPFSALLDQLILEGFAPRRAERLFTIADNIDQMIDIIDSGENYP